MKYEEVNRNNETIIFSSNNNVNIHNINNFNQEKIVKFI